ncbi:transcription antitermination factor NusB [Cuneatibacter caecimuris]|uniref:Transcription antitermination protein NusB n=1 Tax=Cuneatibacter caecimuris TaxID=1796618 RepID=A0A4V2F5H7_9FIRM|nr:transcription antitermination factor NusB [Cuneatibacter caecimuris]RZS92859.1 NusB antitermination factor [Cuneatibacter caecimuris]
MTRRAMREHVFKIVFHLPFYPAEEMDGQIERYWKSAEDVTEAEQALLTGKAKEILAKVPELDEKITASTEGWRLNRFNRVDLAVVRLALYEMLYDEEVPVKVSINEAVELAKKFGGDESPQFVNGILAKLLKAEGLDGQE